jgi:hypothetical protein
MQPDCLATYFHFLKNGHERPPGPIGPAPLGSLGHAVNTLQLRFGGVHRQRQFLPDLAGVIGSGHAHLSSLMRSTIHCRITYVKLFLPASWPLRKSWKTKVFGTSKSARGIMGPMNEILVKLWGQTIFVSTLYSKGNFELPVELFAAAAFPHPFGHADRN